MNENKPMVIGLFGFGVVGEGIYKVLLETPSLNATIKKICIKHPDKKRNAPAELFTTNYDLLLGDAEINLIVELIDDADEAFKIVSTSLKNKKSVVSANKKMIAEHLHELLQLQRENDVPFLYEAAVCGSIPVLRNLEEYYDNDLLKSISGIVNGSTNYILTKMMDEGQAYKDALLDAQQLGFAERNPSLDVEGWDAANKLTILLLHAYGHLSHPVNILRRGITQLHEADAKLAKEKGYKIKLVARAQKIDQNKIAAFVLPQFVMEDSQLYNVRNEYNGVVIESKLADHQFLFGKGAGRYPTASAVLSDIAALRYQYRYEYRKLNANIKWSLSDDFYLRLYIGYDKTTEIAQWSFEHIDIYHSTPDRQYIVGVLHISKLTHAAWFNRPDVSVILMPDGVIEKKEILQKEIMKLSKKLAGTNE